MLLRLGEMLMKRILILTLLGFGLLLSACALPELQAQQAVEAQDGGGGLPEGFPRDIPLLPGDVPSSLIGTATNRTAGAGRWYTTKANPHFGKMADSKAEAAAAREAAKLLTDAGYISLPGKHGTLFTNETYYVVIRVVGELVLYEVGPDSLLHKKKPVSP